MEEHRPRIKPRAHGFLLEKSGQCTCRNIWKRKEMSSDVAVSLTADSQTYVAPNWLLMRWCRGTTDCGLGIAGATELQRGHLQLSLLGHGLALRA
jgi:hypothetical protein